MGCFGITKDTSSNYMFVTKYFEDGDYLYSRIDEAHGILDWKNIVEMLWGISGRIEYIHDESESFYGNLHGGNLFVKDGSIRIIDTGLQCSNDSSKIYGVLPFIAPEILKGNLPTKFSDIYSFGIIMWTLSAGVRPWCNRPHDLRLAIEICSGLRPEIIDETPNIYIQYMKRCWDSDPSKRPTASELFDLTEEKRFSNLRSDKFNQQKIHPEAFYTSRLLYFLELASI